MDDAEKRSLENRNKQLLDALFKIMDITRSECSVLKANSPAKRAFRVANSAVQI